MAYSFSTSVRGLCVAIGLLAGACGSDAPPSLLPGGDGSVTLDGGADQGPCPQSTRACDCPATDAGPAHQGLSTCFDGQWLPCNCFAQVAPPVATEGECKAGRYEGEFSGIYTSGFTFIGVPIPIYSVDLTGQPGLAFTLNEQRTSVGAEFSTLTISDGYVTGTADGLFPIEGVLTGELDCATKKFTGTLSGGYCVTLCAGVNEAAFEGPIVGYYDADGFKFTSGTWDLLEVEGNSGFFGAYGGNGEWNAHWVGEGSVDLGTGQTTDGGAADAGVASDAGP